MVKKLSMEDRKYEVPDEIYSVKATFLNSALGEAQIERLRSHLQWDEKTYQKKLRHQRRKQKRKTYIFLNLFSPKRTHKNLQNTHNLWNVFLTHKTKRYKPQIRKYSKPFSMVQFLYPLADRWSASYMLMFPLPTEELDKEEFTLTLSGREGQSVLVFNKKL